MTNEGIGSLVIIKDVNCPLYVLTTLLKYSLSRLNLIGKGRKSEKEKK